jgi:hypothetical protein
LSAAIVARRKIRCFISFSFRSKIRTPRQLSSFEAGQKATARDANINDNGPENNSSKMICGQRYIFQRFLTTSSGELRVYGGGLNYTWLDK